MESQDLEEALGNLVENAAKFARQSITIRLRPVPAAGDQRPMFRIDIEDDGPGLDEAGMREAVKRGRRLDETKPGTGLGLSIVGEIASEYNGAFALAKAGTGGLSARLTLPALVQPATIMERPAMMPYFTKLESAYAILPLSSCIVRAQSSSPQTQFLPCCCGGIVTQCRSAAEA